MRKTIVAVQSSASVLSSEAVKTAAKERQMTTAARSVVAGLTGEALKTGIVE